VFLFALLFTTLLVPYLVLLQPLGATMTDVKWQLCGGNQTFVLAQNAQTQVVTGLATTRGGQEMSVVERAVKEHIFNQQETPYYISFQPGPTQFDSQRTADMQADQEGPELLGRFLYVVRWRLGRNKHTLQMSLFGLVWIVDVEIPEILSPGLMLKFRPKTARGRSRYIELMAQCN